MRKLDPEFEDHQNSCEWWLRPWVLCQDIETPANKTFEGKVTGEVQKGFYIPLTYLENFLWCKDLHTGCELQKRPVHCRVKMGHLQNKTSIPDHRFWRWGLGWKKDAHLFQQVWSKGSVLIPSTKHWGIMSFHGSRSTTREQLCVDQE